MATNDKLGALSDYILLGKSGLRVSPLCLGAMTFGTETGLGSNEEESLKVFNAYYEQGGNFVDTANVYTHGTSESMVGKFIAQRRSNMVVATKYTINWAAPGFATKLPDSPGGFAANTGGNSRKSLVESLDGSIKRLGVNYIDLFYVHAWEFRTPITEVLRALDDVVRSGKVLYLGLSDTPAWVASSANSLADVHGWTRFIAYQTRYNLLDRSYENDIQDVCQVYGIGGVPWGCLAEGFLTGKYDRTKFQESAKSEGIRASSQWGFILDGHAQQDSNWAVVDKVKEIAKAVNKTPAQVALNWIAQRPGVASPLIGARTEEQLKQNIDALSFKLSAEQIAELDKVSAAPTQPFPYSFFQRNTKTDMFTAPNFNVERRAGHPFLL